MIGDGVVEGCSYLFASDVDMATVDGFALTSWERGYGDIGFRPDFTTIRMVPWHEKTVNLFADVETVTANLSRLRPARSSNSRCRALPNADGGGLTGTELEFIVFEDTYEEAWKSGYRNMTPVNLYNVDYSLQGTSRIEPFSGASAAR